MERWGGGGDQGNYCTKTQCIPAHTHATFSPIYEVLGIGFPQDPQPPPILESSLAFYLSYAVMLLGTVIAVKPGKNTDTRLDKRTIHACTVKRTCILAPTRIFSWRAAERNVSSRCSMRCVSLVYLWKGAWPAHVSPAKQRRNSDLVRLYIFGAVKNYPKSLVIVTSHRGEVSQRTF